MMQQQMITIDNYEEFFFLAADGELDEAQQQALQRFLREHPQLESEFREAASLKLAPDETLQFEDKASLLKEAPKRRVIPLSNAWKAFAAAASISLLIWAGYHSSKSEEEVHGGSVAASFITTTSVPFTNAPSKTTQPSPPNTATTVLTADAHPTKFYSHLPRHQSPVSTQKNVSIEALPQLATLQSTTRMTTNNAIAATPAITMIEMPDNNEQQRPENHQNDRKVRFATENLAAIETLKDAAKATLDRFTNSPYRFRDAAFSVKLGDRKISINF